MEQKKRTTFPKDFFTKPRPTVTTKETLKDIIPLKWSKEVSEGKKKAIVYSTKEKDIL